MEYFEEKSIDDAVSETFEEDYQNATNSPKRNLDFAQEHSTKESSGFCQGKSFTINVFIEVGTCFSVKNRSYISSLDHLEKPVSRSFCLFQTRQI